MLALMKIDELTSRDKGHWTLHEGTVVMSCPECGKLGTLSDHTIRDDGMVAPSVVCVNPDCSFHDTVKLLGWRAT